MTRGIKKKEIIFSKKKKVKLLFWSSSYWVINYVKLVLQLLIVSIQFSPLAFKIISLSSLDFLSVLMK